MFRSVTLLGLLERKIIGVLVAMDRKNIIKASRKIIKVFDEINRGKTTIFYIENAKVKTG